MADADPKEDKDALDALELEAKEFDKVCLRLSSREIVVMPTNVCI